MSCFVAPTPSGSSSWEVLVPNFQPFSTLIFNEPDRNCRSWTQELVADAVDSAIRPWLTRNFYWGQYAEYKLTASVKQQGFVDLIWNYSDMDQYLEGFKTGTTYYGSGDRTFELCAIGQNTQTVNRDVMTIQFGHTGSTISDYYRTIRIGFGNNYPTSNNYAYVTLYGKR